MPNPDHKSMGSTKTDTDINRNMTESEAAVELPVDEPNVVFIGKNKNQVQTKFNNGMETIKLPKVEEQVTISEEKASNSEEMVEVVTGKPFYHKKANTIIRAFRGLYKEFRPKKG